MLRIQQSSVQIVKLFSNLPNSFVKFYVWTYMIHGFHTRNIRSLHWSGLYLFSLLWYWCRFVERNLQFKNHLNEMHNNNLTILCITLMTRIFVSNSTIKMMSEISSFVEHLKLICFVHNEFYRICSNHDGLVQHKNDIDKNESTTVYIWWVAMWIKCNEFVICFHLSRSLDFTNGLNFLPFLFCMSLS